MAEVAGWSAKFSSAVTVCGYAVGKIYFYEESLIRLIFVPFDNLPGN